MDSIIVSTRPAAKYRDPAGKYCFRLVNIPVTKIVEEPEFKIEEFIKFDPEVCVFTSSTGVKSYLDHFGKKVLEGRGIIAIGDHTAEPLINAGFNPLLPDTFDSYGIQKIISNRFTKEKIALIRSNKGSNELLDFLSSGNYNFKEFVVYTVERLQPDLSMLLSPDCKGVLITSSFEASIVLDFLSSTNGKTPELFAIGKTTADFLLKMGKAPGSEIPNSSFRDALEIIKAKICKN